MNPSLLLRGLFVSLGLAALTALAFEVGGFAWTKRVDTVLRTEPRALAPESGRVAHGRKLKVLEMKNGWLRVSEGATTGWVFAGNVSEQKIATVKGLVDDVPELASKTTATAAARPLTPAAQDYAASRNLGDARAHLDWMSAENAKVTPEVLEAFLVEQKKGEYR